jgi:hypothetical protein
VTADTLLTLDQAAALIPGADEFPEGYCSPYDKPTLSTRISENMHREIGTRRQCVYFIGNSLFVKIGYTTNVSQRLGDLHAMSPFPLYVLLLARGGFDQESEFHDRFARQWIKGEWFRHDGKLAEFIATERVKFA